ncbi:WcaI family glycosyltransferase [Rhodoplanes sp. TEM]|uniref:WcaI family glycosyltransferase n=1 Tax=Rhodoplanes tepidamans TaxID=200616 RepID=A0ABT5JBS1_RHOTP|nr:MULTISPECIES: WcaI family glycosyltransferase [Rhodoplanes]MDC7786709.1 WcaI family glycosyltransferase [Rhodoplanes tepidamans]MDC7983715.1 WcaI family glycosyltransferase [Rhodoplanes sp. TEM]MDQ0358145.1 colanic acid biosynthesis glycosyl transferase WcaI [Rhodoplanes tepidamans]
MRILVCGINYAPDLIGVPKYNTELCESLAGFGHEVRVVTAPPYYPAWHTPAAHRVRLYRRERRNGVSLVRAPIYVPARPSGARRLLHHASFAASSALPLASAALSWRPDIVFAVAPSLLSAPIAALAARMCGATAWLHLQDLEIDAAFGLGLLKDGGLRRAMLVVERGILGVFDRVSTISPQMIARLEQKGVPRHRLYELRNWVDVAAIRPGARDTRLRAELGLGPSDVVALYSGAMSHKQGLDLVVAAAAALQATDPHIRFVLCGNGPHREDLQRLGEGLENLRFLDLQPAERLSELLATADIHLMPQRPEAADLVLPSKLSGMLASGRPVVVMAEPGTGIACEAEGAGLVTRPGNVDDLVAAVRTLAADSGLRAELGAGARQRAERAWDRGAIMAGLDEAFASLGRAARAGGPQVSSALGEVRGGPPGG